MTNHKSPMTNDEKTMVSRDVLDREISKRRKLEATLERIKGFLTKCGEESEDETPYVPPYGNLEELNVGGQIRRVGQRVLTELLDDFLDLLDSSAKVYEKNGDYALIRLQSGWCRTLTAASRNLCGTMDNREALWGGKWLCHESSWNKVSKKTMETGKAVDIECSGGIRIYSVPIFAETEIIGSINLGYGDPPKDLEKLQEIADRYSVSLDTLSEAANLYVSRPPYIIETAKRRMALSARLIGAMVEQKRSGIQVKKYQNSVEEIVQERTGDLDQRVSDVERLNKAMVNLVEDLQANKEKLEHVSRKLYESNKDLEAFGYSVSHDLRTPLRAVVGFSRMLIEDYADKLDAEGRRKLKVVQNSAREMGQLIEDLLAFSRLGRKEIHTADIDMRALAEEVFGKLQLANTAQRARLEIDRCPPVSGDLPMIREVLMNLFSNAIKFGKPNETAVIKFSGTVEGNETVYSVKDNGVGFDTKYSDKLFHVFKRLHRPEEFEGTGIGLAFVQRIIQRHHGRVWAESQLNQGATFYFSLPKGEK